MDVALKIWRSDPDTGKPELKRYEVEAPEWACLLDVLDIIKDAVDGTLAYRKSCRMMICGSCGMRMDGRAVLACKERMKPILDVTISRFHAFDRLQSELTAAKSALEDRKIIEQAKAILMRQRNCSEEDAYVLLRRTAMNQNRKIAELARSLVDAAALLGSGERSD